MIYVLYVIHVIVCIFLILVVLLQQGKGADLSVFGGGSTQTAFGARGATTLLHKLTVGSFVVFTVTTLVIAILDAGPRGATVMEEVMEQSVEDTTTPRPITDDANTAPEETPAETNRELTGEAPTGPGIPGATPPDGAPEPPNPQPDGQQPQ